MRARGAADAKPKSADNGCLIEHFGNADAVPHTEPQSEALEQPPLAAEIRRRGAWAVRRELCAVLPLILVLPWNVWVVAPQRMSSVKASQTTVP